MSKLFKILPAMCILSLLTVGVTMHNNPTIYAGILAVCVVVILVAVGVLKRGQHPYLLFAIALGMVFQLTLAGKNLIGPDVHLEYYWAQFYSGEDVWYPLRYYCPAAGLGSVVFAPIIQKAFLIPNLWTFKVIFPICFAFVPVVLYHLFKRWVDDKKAFIASFMFIAFPAFLLEMPGIPESMLAELFMVLALYFVIVGKYKLRYRIPLIIACGLLASFTHYSMGFITIIFLVLAFFTKIILKVRNGIPHKAMAVVCVMVVVGSVLFFSFIASGAVMLKVSGIWNSWVPKPVLVSYWHYPAVQEEAPQPLESPAPLPVPSKIPSYIPEEGGNLELTSGDIAATGIVEMTIETDTEITTINASTGEIIKVEPKVKPLPKPWLERYHDLMRTALGLDFAGKDALGRIFRGTLWVVLLCMLIGVFAFRKNKEFWIFASGALVVVIACLHPRVSPILNASRFFHFALIVLVPTFVLGGLRIFRKLGILTIIIVVPYFLFTSGFVFEITKYESVSVVNIPYSFSLSDDRLDLGTSVTDSDREVIGWIAQHKEPEDKVPFPIFSDTVGTSALCEVIGYRPDLMRAFYKYPNLMPKPPYYVFVRERNIQDGSVVIYTGIGQRDYYPFARFGFDVNKNIVYQVGESRVIYVGGND